MKRVASPSKTAYWVTIAVCVRYSVSTARVCIRQHVHLQGHRILPLKLRHQHPLFLYQWPNILIVRDASCVYIGYAYTLLMSRIVPNIVANLSKYFFPLCRRLHTYIERIGEYMEVYLCIHYVCVYRINHPNQLCGCGVPESSRHRREG